jgi:hypothetical protein
MRLHQIQGPASGNDPAAIDDHDLVAQPLRLLHVMGRQHHGLAALAHGLDQAPEVAPRLRIETGGRLVQEHQPGIVDQGDGQQQALALPPGELAGVPVQDLLRLQAR